MKSKAINRIVSFLRKMRVADMKAIQSYLKGRAIRSLFRDLKKIDCQSSFTHAGKYYTLRETPVFDSHGLWFHTDVGFVREGTLKEATLRLVRESDVGCTHEELENIFRVRVHNTLLDLVCEKKLRRRKIGGVFVYLSSEVRVARKQEKKRQAASLRNVGSRCEVPDWLVIEILAEIIRMHSVSLRPEDTLAGLHAKGVCVTLQQIELVFERLDFKKNTLCPCRRTPKKDQSSSLLIDDTTTVSGDSRHLFLSGQRLPALFWLNLKGTQDSREKDSHLTYRCHGCT